MKFRNVWMALMACVLAAGLLSGCEGEAEPSPEVSDPVVSASQPQEGAKAPVVEPEKKTEDLPPEDVPMEEKPGEVPLSKAQLADWEEWLNEPTVRELFHSPFENAGEVKLKEMFYDGVDEVYDSVTEEEWAALEEIRGTIHTGVTRVTVDEIISAFREMFGVELTRKEIAERLEGWAYLEEYDAYYHLHGDTLALRVTCVDGVIDPEDDSVRLTCQADNKTYTVGLTALKESYIIDYIRLEAN